MKYYKLYYQRANHHSKKDYHQRYLWGWEHSSDGKPLVVHSDTFGQAYSLIAVSLHPTGGLVVRECGAPLKWQTNRECLFRCTYEQATIIDKTVNYGFFGPRHGDFFETIGKKGVDWEEIDHKKRVPPLRFQAWEIKNGMYIDCDINQAGTVMGVKECYHCYTFAIVKDDGAIITSHTFTRNESVIVKGLGEIRVNDNKVNAF